MICLGEKLDEESLSLIGLSARDVRERGWVATSNKTNIGKCRETPLGNLPYKGREKYKPGDRVIMVDFKTDNYVSYTISDYDIKKSDLLSGVIVVSAPAA